MADFDTPREVVDPERPLEAEPPQVGDETPEADALEQQAGVLPDDEVAQTEPLEFEPELEANPADVDEQRRVVPLPDDESRLPQE